MTVQFPNLRHLRAFQEVALHHSISVAATHVHLSQPAVTQAINGLERSLNVALFHRRSNGMIATQIGQILLKRVQRLFSHLHAGAHHAVAPRQRRAKTANPDFYKLASASQLRAFIAIWETGSFSLAARAIGISQPSVHRAGRDLEKLAGEPFFQFNSKGIELTPAAQQFARAVKLAAVELQQAYDEIELAQGRDSTRINVGSMPLSRTAIVPGAIHALLNENQGVQVRSTDGPYGELLRGLRYGDLDCLIGALRDPNPAEDVTQELLLKDTLKVVTGPEHPLAKRGKVTLEDTLQYPWIAPPKGTPSGQYLYHSLKIEDRLQTPVRIVASSLVLIRGLLLKGDYITILSERQMALEHEHGLMVALDIPLQDSDRLIGLTTRSDWTPTATQSRFLDLVRDAARDCGSLYAK